jgi:hypothetical protein
MNPRTFLLVFLLTLSSVAAQAPSSQLSGQIRGSIALSVAQISFLSPHPVSITTQNPEPDKIIINIPANHPGEMHLRIPVQIRSNIRGRLSAEIITSNATIAGLLVTGIRATGDKIMAGAVEEISVQVGFNSRRGAKSEISNMQPDGRQNFPTRLLSFPRISRTGNQTSPGNAIEIILNLSIRSTPAYSSGTVRLILTAV